MLCEVIGNYSIYCGNEYIGYVNVTNDNTFGIASKDESRYNLEEIFDCESLLEKIRQKKDAFSVLNQYGLFRFVSREHYSNIYDCFYEYQGFA